MESYLTRLTEEEKKQLLMAPVVVSLIAALEDNKIEESEEEEAERIAHIKTFSGPEILQKYYKAVETNFERNFRRLKDQLPQDKDKSKEFLTEKFKRIQLVIEKTDKPFSNALKESLKSFTHHVAEADYGLLNELELVIFPFFGTK